MSRVFLQEIRQASLPPDLLARMTGSPHAVFRFVNRSWMEAVCRAFEDEVGQVPAVRLHGDPHVEQYAVTADARGLDDFDDSATGPALVDLVRFLGSVAIIEHERGWDEARDGVADAFLDGYRRALRDQTYLPPAPAVVTRLRALGERSRAEYLEWAESLMQPLQPDEQANLAAAWPSLVAYAREANPALTDDDLRIKRAGWLQLGIGSALNRKLLVRIEARSRRADDDVILEARELLTLSGVTCLNVPKSGELFRVVEGISQLGRLQHRVLAVVPIFERERPNARGWWVKDWAPSYRELEVADIGTPQELAEVAHDVGAQLGGANLVDASPGLAPQKRLMEIEVLARVEPRVRLVAAELARAVEDAWRALVER